MWIQRLKILLVLCGVMIPATAMLPRLSSPAAAEPAAAPAQASQAARQNSGAPSVKDYNKFTHKSHSGSVRVPGTQQTRELKCDYCHDRSAPPAALVASPERNKKILLDFPVHRTCIECHVVQFTAKPPETCSVCHQADAGLTARPPQREFPERYDFNVYFDAKQHETHDTYTFTDGSKLDCAFCHAPTQRQVGREIGAHGQCFVCHAPASNDQKAQQKSDCSVCHTQMVDKAPKRNLLSIAYGARFSHQTHVGYVSGDCKKCHSVTGGYNQPSAKPGTIRVRQHLSERERGGRGCFSCHDGNSHPGVNNGRPVFTGEYTAPEQGACTKCHGDNLKVTPARG